jgi:ribose 5-phosphate isomerase
LDAAERLPRLAKAVTHFVLPGMLVGIGTGSTADAVIREPRRWIT